MWSREFKDYPTDSTLKQEKVEPGKGIIGCEMHEPFGWGSSAHHPPPPKKIGFFRTLLKQIFGE